jgi:RNA polymerase sigma factor (sigma-70 family)
MGVHQQLRTAPSESGPTATIDEVITRHQRMVTAIARRILGDGSDIDDVVQETWISYLRNAGSIVSSASIGPWLARVATNHAYRLARHRARQEPVADLASRVDASADELDLVDYIHSSERRLALRQVMAALSPPDRELLGMLSNADALRYQEISRRTGRPVGTLGPQRGRLIRKLRLQPSLRRLCDITELSVA